MNKKNIGAEPRERLRLRTAHFRLCSSGFIIPW